MGKRIRRIPNEELKKLLGDGADEKGIDASMALHGSDLETHKSTATKAGEDLKAVQGQLDEAKTRIKSFEDMKPEDLKKAVGDWEAKYKELETQHANETKQRTFEAALEKGLVAAKVKDVVAVKAHLKLDGLKLNEDGTFADSKSNSNRFRKKRITCLNRLVMARKKKFPRSLPEPKEHPQKLQHLRLLYLKARA
jgi:hypothetical protein